ncbi:hypothetical protein PITCH_A1540002 [uncultured Desulfobacterium sp.]|uniref:Recombinase family protein n=1 Tax=uncultured Desulfobacterium sp. TaxID=201089 RepID=A0A445MTS2_9BACT|nr:hypothetical protein PITCH_A1540002 [uncultured Desulfobacterium sp.]
MTTCGIYYRVSSENQKEQKTIQSQQYELPLYAAKQGWDIVDTYTDEGISGSFIAGRSEFQRCLQDMKAKKFDILLGMDLDRLTRTDSWTERGEILGAIQESGVKLASPADGLLDISQFSGSIMTILKMLMSADEKAKIASRLKRGRKQKTRDGNYAQAKVPFGLKRITDRDVKPITHKIVIDEGQAKTIRMIYDLIINDGKSLGFVADYLNQLGIKPPRGKAGQMWNSATLSSMLRINESSWTGALISNRYNFKQVGDRKFKFLGENEEAEWIRTKVPAIFTKEEYFALKARLSQNRNESRLQNVPETFLLRQMLKCGICGRPLTCKQVAPKGTKFRNKYYVCSGRLLEEKFIKITEKKCNGPYVKAELLDSYVEGDFLKKLFMFPETTLKAWTQEDVKDGVAKNLEIKLESKEDEINKVKQKLTNLMDESIGGLFDLNMVKAKKAELDKTLKILNDERDTLQKELSRIATIEQNKKALEEATLDLSKLGNKLSAKVAKLNITEERKLLSYFIKEGHIEIDFCHPEDVHYEQDANGRKIKVDWDYTFKGVIDLAILVKVLKEFDKTGKVPDPLSFYLRNKDTYMYSCG